MHTNISQMSRPELRERIARTEQMITETTRFMRHMYASKRPGPDLRKLARECMQHQREQLESMKSDLKEMRTRLSERDGG